MSEVATSLMLNDTVEDGAEEGSLELLGLPSVGSVRDDNSFNANIASLPALPSPAATSTASLSVLPSATNAVSLPALPSTTTVTSLSPLPSTTG